MDGNVNQTQKPNRAARRRTRKVNKQKDYYVGEVESRPDVGPDNSKEENITRNKFHNSTMTDIKHSYIVISLVMAGIILSIGDTDNQWYDNFNGGARIPFSAIAIAIIASIMVLSYNTYVLRKIVYYSGDANVGLYNLGYYVYLILLVGWVLSFANANLDLAFMCGLLSIVALFFVYFFLRKVDKSKWIMLHAVLGVYLMWLSYSINDVASDN